MLDNAIDEAVLELGQQYFGMLFTTFERMKVALQLSSVDYYGLPMSGNGAWPGRAESSSSPFEMKAKIVEDRILQDVQSDMGNAFYRTRFVPYLMMHEFEALLFSDCANFCNGIGKSELIE